MSEQPTNETGCNEHVELGSFENDSNLNKLTARNLCASIIGKLQSSGIPNNAVSAIVNDLEEFTNELQSQIKQEVLS